MTRRQQKAEAAWHKAIADHRKAAHGERRRAERHKVDAATDALKAYIAAKKKSRKSACRHYSPRAVIGHRESSRNVSASGPA